MDTPRSPHPPTPSLADAHFEQLYGELRGMARALLGSERPNHTLQATALVNEAYLRLLKAAPEALADEGRFQQSAAVAMRRILVEHARSRARDKRGGSAERIPMDALQLAATGQNEDLLAIEEALQRLDAQDPELAKLVQLRFYAGLSPEETAKVLGCSVRSVFREWSYAKALLLKALETPDS